MAYTTPMHNIIIDHEVCGNALECLNCVHACIDHGHNCIMFINGCNKFRALPYRQCFCRYIGFLNDRYRSQLECA